MKKLSIRVLSTLMAMLIIAVNCPFVSLAINNEMSINVTSASGCPGESVQVDVELSNNPGISSLKFNVNYDEENLTLKTVTFAEGYGSYVTAPEPYKNPQTISLISPLQVINTNGLLATLTFEISQNAGDNITSNISITYDEDDVFDGDYNNVALNITNGCINIYHGIPGDIDGDRKVNNKDAILLFRYIAGWNVEVDLGALDCNGDGKVNNKDAIILFRSVAGWPNITLVRGVICNHNLEAFAKKDATCTEAGNIAYWHCTKCDKYFSDELGKTEITLADTVIEAKGHTVVIDEAVAPTSSSTGLTEGSHCSTCGTVISPQEVIPILTSEQYLITYEISANDDYLARISINNPNPNYYTSDDGLKLSNLKVDGYIFDGWYDGEGLNATLVKEIPKGETGAKELYAHWSLKEYTITFDSPLVPVNSIKYTVNTGTTLTNPSLSNYIFMGWTDDDGNVVTSIKPGTTGNITLHANWTSRRNMTKPLTSYGDPIVTEIPDEGIILFAYEIGTIENVPVSDLSQVYTAVAGMSQTYTTSGTTSVSSSSAQTIANTVSNATTNSGAWSLSSNWNDVTSVSQSYIDQNQITQSEAETMAKTDSQTYSLNSSSGGTSTIVDSSGTSAKRSASNNNQTTTERQKGVELSAEVEANVPFGKVKGGAKYTQNKKTIGTEGTTIGAEAGYDNSHSSTDASTWNSSSGYSASHSTSSSQTVSNTLSKLISETKNYGSSYSEGGSSNSSQSFANSTSETDQYTTAITYSSAETTTKTQTFEFGGESEGYYKVVLAGTAHVFGVVGYDVTTASYFVYTYTVMDDNTYPWVDYSRTSAQFNDYENGVLQFEVPYDIREYVIYRTNHTDGLVINTKTGIIENYTGEDNVVYIPAYIVIENIDGNGNAKTVKVNGISSNAFQGNENIKAVCMTDFISEIPDNAFKGCTSLTELVGFGITSIGNNAFDGCSALKEFAVSEDVTYLGTNAFNGLDKVVVKASNAQVASAAVSCGAKEIVLNIASVDGSLSGTTFEVPNTTEYFELQGGNKTYSDLRIVSDASTTYLNGIIIRDCTRIPLVISSSDLILNGVEVISPGYVMLLPADETNIELYQESNLITNSDNAIVCKNMNLSIMKPGITSGLNVYGNILIYGEITGENYLNVSNGAIIHVSEQDFAKYIQGSFKLIFNANGGTLSETEKVVFCGSAVGELPTPTRDYYSFDGWFTEGGEQVTASTIYDMASDITLYARYTIHPIAGWVRANEAPAGAQIVAEKWSYNLTEHTPSSQSTLSGWVTEKDPTWVWSEWGNWSGWSTTPYYTSESRDVGTRSVYDHTDYHYYRYINGNYVYTYAKSGYAREEATFNHALPKSSLDSFEAMRYDDTNGLGDVYRNRWIMANYVDNPGDKTFTTDVYRTEYRYRDRYKIYTYYFKRVVSKESLTEVTNGGDIADVQKWVQYRAK